MKLAKITLITLTTWSLVWAQMILSDDFSYSDGSLVGNSAWVSHSGTAGDLLVSGGQAVVQHGTPSEDVNIPFDPVAGVLYYAFDFSVIDPGAPISGGGDYEYFAHFKAAGNSDFCARLDIVPPSVAGDYSVGIASDESTADNTWATDLSYGTTYRATVKYDQDDNIATLWIDAASESDPSIVGEDRSDPGDVVVSFALRQSDSSDNEGILVDNLVVGQTFADVIGVSLALDGIGLPDVFALHNNYPNPFNPVTNITYDISEVTQVTLDIYNISGQKVSTLAQGQHEPGRYRIQWNATNNYGKPLSSGMYIYRIHAGNFVSVKKLILMK